MGGEFSSNTVVHNTPAPATPKARGRGKPVTISPSIDPIQHRETVVDRGGSVMGPFS